jgi:hypothetical protein
MKKQLLLLLMLTIGIYANAQFTPANLYELKYSFPGLKDDYTQVTVDANLSSSGPVTWTPIETIDVTRNGSGLITGTEVISTFPVDLLKATASKTGNVYTSLVQKNTNGTWKEYQRETIFSDGTKDTAYMLEMYDEPTLSYNKKALYVIQYNSNGKFSGSIEYIMSGSTWVPSRKDELTYSGNNYSVDTGYNWVSSAWVSKSYTNYFYVGDKLDSSVKYINNAGSYALDDIYSYQSDANGDLNVIIAYSESSGVFGPNTRSTFGGAGSTGITAVSNQPSFTVYPNPANDRVTINTYSTHSVKVEVMNINGQKMVDTMMNDNDVMDCSYWASGMYIIKVTSGAHSISYKKLVIE